MVCLLLSVWLVTSVTAQPDHPSGVPVQYYLTVSSAYDSPIPTSGWYINGSIIAASVAKTWAGPTGTRYVCTGWTGTGSVQSTGTTSAVTFTIDQNSSVTWNWKTQYYLTVIDGGHGTASGQYWYDAGTDAAFDISPTTVSGGTGVQYVFTGWSSSDPGGYTDSASSYSVNMSNPITETANWKTQYYLTVTSPYDAPGGQGWYDSGSTASSVVSSPVSGGTGVQYVATGYTGSGSAPSGSGTSVSFNITSPSSITWNWKTQYYLSVVDGGHGTASGQNWYDVGTPATFGISPTTVSDGTGVEYVFTGWSSSDAGGYTGSLPSTAVTMNNPITETGHWNTQYYLTLKTDPSGIVTIPGQDWYDSPTPVTLTAPAGPPTHPFLYWVIDGVSQGSGVNPIVVTMSAVHTATAHYYTAPVGGEWAPINRVQMVTPWVALASIGIAVAAAGSHRLLKKRL